MALLGFLIVVAVALAIAAFVFRGGDSVRIDLEWFTINTQAWVVFAAGALSLLMLVLGLWLLTAGLKRSRQRRAEVKNLRKRADANDQAARSEPAAPSPTPSSTGENQPRSPDGPDENFDSAPRER